MLDEALRARIEGAIGDATGEGVRVRNVEAAGGGSISEAFVVGDGTRRWFVKVNRAALAPMFDAEADGLAALAQCPALRVPKVVAQGVDGPHAFLVLEHLALRPLRERGEGAAAGEALAALHRIEGTQHGWPRNNFIGRNPQDNAMHVTWPFFFAHHRLQPQLDMARTRADCRRLIERGEKLADRLAAFFVDYRPKASLLHGDLWNGNAAVDESGRLALFDPAVYFGDRDTDLAMSELFGGFPESFYVAYRAAWPLAPGYEQRKTLYNLYHVLNHLNLFGGGYLRQAERMVEALLADL